MPRTIELHILSLMLLSAVIAARAADNSSGAESATLPGNEKDPAVLFLGQAYNLHDVKGITNGWGAYYAPHDENPDDASDEIIINHMNANDGQGNPLSAERLFNEMLGHVRQRGGIIISPFKVPDPAISGAYVHYVTFYYLYPKDGNADIWLSRIFQSTTGAISVLYKHRVDEGDPAVIETNVRHWLGQNLQIYGNALSALQLPSEPSEPRARLH
jgi:hypothetical protein